MIGKLLCLYQARQTILFYKNGCWTRGTRQALSLVIADYQTRPGEGETGSICTGAPARERSPNYIASLLCRESVDGSQEAVGRGPPDNFTTNMGFLYVTDEDQIRFTNLLNRIIEQSNNRHVHYMCIFYVLTKICVVISHVKLKHFHLKYPYIRFICKMACEIFARGPQFFILPQPTLVICAGVLITRAGSENPTGKFPRLSCRYLIF